MSLTKHNKHIISLGYILIFCDSHRVGDGQKAFFDISRVLYLKVLEELFEWQTQ